jgi:polyhydroxyalkanoate synthase
MAEPTPKSSSPSSTPQDEDLPRSVGAIGDHVQRLVNDFLARTASDPSKAMNLGMGDAGNVAGAFLELASRVWANPQKVMNAQISLWEGYMELWRNATLRALGGPIQPVAEPEPEDKRFKADEWQENAVFDFIKQSYLLSSRWLESTVKKIDGLDPQTQRKVNFYTRQFTDALSPTNFALTNPEVIRATIETKGENLVKGLEHLLADLEKGGGRLRISMTDEGAFRVGENVAVTPGKIVAQTELMQLIQYQPTTKDVKEIPVVIIPPWINKYYILDLRPKNSFVKWITDQGYTVFIVSWVNPDSRLAEKRFEDYMVEGALAAKDAAMKVCRVSKVNMVGYCLGGTLLSATLAYLRAKGDTTVVTATYLAALTDFREVGDLRVFVDEEQVTDLEKRMAEAGGFLDAADMATTFNMLRANDLIWSFVVSNYLLGKEPFPFDLLYWNSDSTRMPAAMHSYYLRNMYLENNLAKPGGITLRGVPIDLRKVDIPTYMISCKEDHIAPWTSTYEGTKLFSGPVHFTLSGSGHIAGIVNPPAANKYGYWTNDKNPASTEKWLKTAKQHDGSWWTDWAAWLAPQSGPSVPARVPGEGPVKAIEDTPGSYVKMRAV